jgi:IS6 family transposase
MYLYRVVDSGGNTLEFLLSPTRDAETTSSFFLKTLPSSTRSASGTYQMEAEIAFSPSVASQATPRVINVDKNAAYPKAIADLKTSGILSDHVELRQVKYQGNVIEQDHRAHQTLN